MILRNKITFFRKIPVHFYAYAIFLIVHVALFNINVAEWGDSYRILRASEYIRQGTYPKDEKRSPLFSVFTATRPDGVDAVLWGRVVMLVFSFLSFYVFEKFSKIYIKDQKYRFLSLIFFIFNPVYLYWSIRIMADVPFSFFVLLFFYLISKWDKLDLSKIALLGLICGLAILTRFEGYLLLFSGLVAVIFHKENIFSGKIKIKDLIKKIWRKMPKAAILGLTTLLVISPWLVYRNPLESKYFEEPERRVYDFKMVWSYFVSILYILGFTSAFYFIFKNLKIAYGFLAENVGITAFIVLELILILLWPAAIPRLFVPLIPFFIVILTICLEKFLLKTEKNANRSLIFLAINFILLLFYIFSQYVLKLQFLILGYKMLAIIVLAQIISIIFLFLKKTRLFLFVIVLSTIIWCSYTINMHRSIFRSIKEASEYSSKNLEGKIAYNDTSAIPDWYLNVSESKVPNSGTYMFFDKKEFLEFNKLKSKDIDYLIISNEHNTNISINLEKRKYLQLMKEFSYNVNGSEFFAKVIRFDSEYKE